MLDEKNLMEPRQKSGYRSTLAIIALFFNVAFAAAVLLILVFMSKNMSCEVERVDGPLSSTDKAFHRQGSFNHHRYDEDCRYDHEQNVLVIDLMGDGYGENATLIYDFGRQLMTYHLVHKKTCFVGELDETVDVQGISNGEVIELPETSGRNFTSTGAIPSGFLATSMSSTVTALCQDFTSLWIEPQVDQAHRVARQTTTSSTTTTTTTSNGNTIVTTTTTTTTTVQN
ncbi:uncharacterized protein [Diadema antillarum]|uniref:uncharacterized protein n=1 Tax=Diadema antillarum TaxID=105358 RepID=UPI003A8A1B7C